MQSDQQANRPLAFATYLISASILLATVVYCASCVYSLAYVVMMEVSSAG